MKTIQLTLILISASLASFAQVGIGNTDPKASLDITASNTATPSSTDGILIPKIDNFPATNPGTDQNGMLVFVTGNGTPTKGFYYWDNPLTSWVDVIGTKNTLEQAYNEGGAGAGKNINASDGAIRINGTDGLLVTGTLNSGNTIDTEITGAGTRMFFNPRTGSFRAGEVNGTQWSDANLGLRSVAFGNNNTASGNSSTALGANNVSSGNRSLTIGDDGLASGQNSVAMGDQNDAIGINSLAQGFNNTASGTNTSTFGVQNNAPSYGEMTVGTFASTYTQNSLNSWNTGDRIFTIGNGQSNVTRSNALTVYKNGLININDAYNMPLTDGSANQVMTTDGAGNVSFQDGVKDADWFEVDTTTTPNAINDNIFTQGNVGIGINSPSARLHIDGTSIPFRIDVFGTEKLRLRNSALEFINSGNSVFIGEFAGFNDDLTNNNNTFVGLRAGFTNTSGSNNTAIGHESLRQNTTGITNVAVGISSLYNNTTGSFNVAIGNGALRDNTTNDNDVAVGALTLAEKETGEGNVAIGNRAGILDQNSERNVYIGDRAGGGLSGDPLENKTDNVFIGYQSGFNESGSNKLYIENTASTTPLLYGEFDNGILRTNGTFQINDPSATGYAFPIADGAANQVLTTDGAGNTSWQNASSGAERINDLIDGKSDNDGSDDGSSIFLGIGAGLNDDSTDNSNIGIGFDALSSNTSGSSNLAIGFRALASTTTAFANIGFGALTLEDNTTGTSNIAIGYNSLNNNTTGASNIAIGIASLNNNTSAFGNVAIGSLSMSTNTVGSSNVAIGNMTLRENTAFSNTAIGANSLQENTTGRNNTATGRQSLQDNTTGLDNVANGYRSLYLNTTGSNNVAIGYRSLYRNTTGDRNIAIGYQAGYNETGSDKLYIETSSSATPLIYGTFDTDEVGINWDSTIALPNTLSVNGNASKTTAGSWLANSDARLKKDIETMNSQDMLNKILAMRGVTYTWNDNKTGLDRPDTIQYGFIAQDLQKIWPTKVSEDGQGFLQTAYGDYDAMFVEAFKAQQAQIQTLKQENKTLTEKLNKLEELEERLSALEASKN